TCFILHFLLTYIIFFFFFIIFRRTLLSTLFPYTTLFRSLFEGTCKLNFNSNIWLSATYRQYAGIIPGIGFNFENVSFSYFYEPRSEEHTSELQSRGHLVCRLLLEKKK